MYPYYQNPYVNNFIQQNPYSSQNQIQVNNSINKVVDSIEMVKSADIPMDGQSYYFPQADGKVVYAKKWLPNCTTQIMEYKVQIPEVDINSERKIESKEITSNSFSELYDRFECIQEKIDNIEKLLSKKTSRRKEVVDDESKSNDI